MTKKIVVFEQIDFENMESVETIDSISLAIQKKLYIFRNPYIGNKRKLIPILLKVIDKYNIKYESILDLFCGSSFISMAMKLLDKRVVCNDILSSAYINALAFVVNRDVILTKKEKKYLVNNRRKENLCPFFENYKDRFTEKEIKKINDYRKNVDDLFGPLFLNNSTLIKSALALSYLQNYITEYCFIGGRLNNGQILAKLEHRLSHPRNQGIEMSFSFKNIRWTKPIYSSDFNKHKAFNLDAIDLLERIDELDIKVDLCYIDPPYGGEQSDYIQMYDFFEGLQFLQGWQEMKKKIKGMKRFTNNRDYEEHFNKLMSLSVKFPWIVISYNNDSWSSIDKICSIIKKYRKRAIVEEFNYSYNYRDKEKSGDGTKEYLILSDM